MNIFRLAACCALSVLSAAAYARPTRTVHPQSQSDDLPRHGVIGLRVGNPHPEQPQDASSNPLMVQQVVPGGAGELAGLQAGDVIRSLDGAPAPPPLEFAAVIARHLAGDSVHIRIARAGQEMEKIAVLAPRPFESSPLADVLYSSIRVGDSRRRIIVTRPRTSGRRPAVLLMGGLGCYSLDGDLMRDSVYGPILQALAKNDFVTMRVEKTGEGDSEGPACTDLKATAELEAQAYVVGLRTLKHYDFVDPGRVFVFAHSLGPLIGSLVLPQETVRGFVAAETIGRSWFEYGIENLRRQAALVGEPLDEVNDDVLAHTRCAYDFYIRHIPAPEVEKLGAQCRDMIRSYAGVPYTFMQQIGDINLARQWKQIDIPVLVLYGSSDPATSADEGRYLAGIINSFHPARATFVELPGMGHDFGRYSSPLEFLNRRKDAKPHPFDEELLTVLLDWLNKRLVG